MSGDEMRERMQAYSAQDLGRLLCELLAEIKKRNTEAPKAQSESDKDVSRIYHDIEFGRFNAADGYALVKGLQNALRHRRNAKHNQAVLKDLTAWIGNHDEPLRRLVRRMESRDYWDLIDQEIDGGAEGPGLKLVGRG